MLLTLSRSILPAGGLIFYDYGMMSKIGTARRGSLLELFYGVYRRDAEAVISALIDLGIIVPTADAVALRRAISFGLDNLLRKASFNIIMLTAYTSATIPDGSLA